MSVAEPHHPVTRAGVLVPAIGAVGPFAVAALSGAGLPGWGLQH